jgi:GTP cyclohydrolase I
VKGKQVTVNKVTVTDGRASGPYDQERAEKAVRELLLALGEDPDREGL